jgi:hypothetical protein
MDLKPDQLVEDVSISPRKTILMRNTYSPVIEVLLSAEGYIDMKPLSNNVMSSLHANIRKMTTKTYYPVNLTFANTFPTAVQDA